MILLTLGIFIIVLILIAPIIIIIFMIKNAWSIALLRNYAIGCEILLERAFYLCCIECLFYSTGVLKIFRRTSVLLGQLLNICSTGSSVERMYYRTSIEPAFYL
jgi:hypothetical protein